MSPLSNTPLLPGGYTPPSGPNPKNQNPYYDTAMQRIMPYMQRALNDARAGFADQGILSSTGGQGRLADVRAQYLSQAGQMAEDSRRFDENLATSQQQFGVQNALDMFEMLTANALQRRALEGRDSTTNRTPAQPDVFRDLFDARWLPPRRASGPVGDPTIDKSRGEVIPHVGGTGKKDLSMMQLEQQAADNAASRAIQRAYLKLAQDEAARAQEQDDPWAQMTAAAATNRDLDPSTPGDQAGLFPRDMLASFTGMYGVDVESEARKGNPRAIAVYKILYPQSWQRRLRGGVQFGPEGQDVWRNPDGSPSAIQNWKPEGAAQGAWQQFMLNSQDDRVFGMSPLGSDNEFFGISPDAVRQMFAGR